MRVLVTGGTGNVGCHTVAALVAAGHQVRLLARSPDKVKPALEPLGVRDVDVALGDVAEAETLEPAMEGCDAVIHAASMFSLDPRVAATMQRVNVEGTRLVLGTAHRLGIDPILYVSSEVSMFPTGGRVLTPDSPVGAPKTPYCRSKADAERVAREFQERGAPVVTTYPGFVWGPHDPHFGEQHRLATGIVTGRIPILPRGGLSLVDVRDVAAIHVAALEPGKGPRRYMATGRHVPTKELVARLRRLTGRRLRVLVGPKWIASAAGKAADLLQRRVKGRLLWSGEGVYIIANDADCDDARTREELGVTPRETDETLTDTVRWLVGAGRIPPEKAGRLAA